MTTEKLELANKLLERIDWLLEEIDQIKWTQYDTVAVRQMELKISGGENKTVTTPASLFRTIGKLILTEYQQELMALEKEFEQL